MFQFLIGTLETDEHDWCHYTLADLFQFLIGTLETIVLPIALVEFLKFQFLIGTLETNSNGLVKATL